MAAIEIRRAKRFYRQNAKAYQEQLDALDSSIIDAFRLKNRKFIVYHPRRLSGRRLRAEMMYALEEEGKESTPQRLQEMIDFARKEQIRVIFYQEEIDSSQSEGFAEEIGAVTTQLSPLAGDYIENLEKMAKTLAEEMQ